MNLESSVAEKEALKVSIRGKFSKTFIGKLYRKKVSITVLYQLIEYGIIYRGKVLNFDQSEAIKQCLLASVWLKFETLPRKYRIL